MNDTQGMNTNHTGDEWTSVSDLMAGLMMVFLAISVFFMLRVEVAASAYKNLQADLYEELREEFDDDLPRWGAVIDQETLAVRFEEPEVLFDTGETTLKPRFREILNDFFPRYIAILTRPEYFEHIEELRIEGHTSSEWNETITGDEAYFKNMELSQGRTRAVLRFVYTMDTLTDNRDWLRTKLTANGLSSSQLILRDGTEDRTASRRVEFRVRTDAEEQIQQIHDRIARQDPETKGRGAR